MSGERVTAEYFYGPFGAESVKLKQGFRSKNVIESIEYNENGQIERIVRGNRTETKYVDLPPKGEPFLEGKTLAVKK